MKLGFKIFIKATTDCIDPADNGRKKISGHRRFSQYLNEKRNLMLPVVDPSKLNLLLVRNVMKKYVRTEDSLFYRYADGPRKVPEKTEGPEVFRGWVSEDYGAGSSAASKSRFFDYPPRTTMLSESKGHVTPLMAGLSPISQMVRWIPHSTTSSSRRFCAQLTVLRYDGCIGCKR